MATKAPTKSRSTSSKGQQAPSRTPTSSPKPQPRSQDSAKLGPTAEGTPLPVDQSADQLQQEQDELQQQAKVSRADAEFIDPDPGYDKDQVAHMSEYYGLS